MAHLTNQIPSDFTNERLPPISSRCTPSETTSCIPAIMSKYQATKDILRTIHEVESLSDSQLLTNIYDRILKRPPTLDEVHEQRIDSIREHCLLQLSQAYSVSQQSLLNLLTQMQFDTISFTNEERKNSQLLQALLEVITASKQVAQEGDFQSLNQPVDRLREVYERHTFYYMTLNATLDTIPREDFYSLKKLTELYWARRIGISESTFIQLLQTSPSLVTLCEDMSSKGLPVELLPARITWLATSETRESNDDWLVALQEYYHELLPLEHHSSLLDPIHNRSSFSNAEAVHSHIELLHSRRNEPNWVAVLSCRILCEEGIKLLKRQKSLSHLATEIAKLVAEDYYGALLAAGIQHGEVLQSLVPTNTQRGFDSAVEILRSQQLLKREYFSPSTPNKISQLFSPGGEKYPMWKAFLNLLVALEKGVDVFEVALRGNKSSSEKTSLRAPNPDGFKKSIKALLQDSLTTLKVLTYQVGELGKPSEYQSQIGILKQSLAKVPSEAIEESERESFELCKRFFFLPLPHSIESSELQGDQSVLAKLIAIARRNCVP